MADYSYCGAKTGSSPIVGDVFGKGVPWSAYFTITELEAVGATAPADYVLNLSGTASGNTYYTTQDGQKGLTIDPFLILTGICGKVTQDGSGLSGVTVSASGLSGTSFTASDGSFWLNTTSSSWTGTLYLSKTNYCISPSSRSYTSLTNFKSGQDSVAELKASQPTNFSPANGSYNPYPFPTQLSWTTGANAVSFDVYFDVYPTSTLVSSQQSGTSWTISPPLSQNTYYCWKVDSYSSLGCKTTGSWKYFHTLSLAPEKPVNPAPTNQEKNVDNKTGELTWEDGGSGEQAATSYDIYFGTESGNLTQIYTGRDASTPTWPSPMVVLEINDYNPAGGSGYRSPQANDELTHGDTTYYVYKVEIGELVNVQYRAKLYAFRVGPEGQSGDELTNGVSPDPDNPQAVKVTLNNSWHFHGEVESAFYPYATRYYWRVDAVNAAGTTTGDEWYFDIESSWQNERPPDYNPDYQWQYSNGSYKWADIDVAGGGRYKNHLVIVGFNCIYYS